MKEARKGQIAFLFLVHQILRDGIHLGSDTPEKIARTAAMIGIGYEEARDFAEIFIRALVDRVFSMSRAYDPRSSRHRNPGLGESDLSDGISSLLSRLHGMVNEDGEKAGKRVKAKKVTKK